MLFIKAYYYIFYTFIYSIVILCTVFSWLRRPKINWTLGQRYINRNPVLSLLRFHSQPG